VTFGLVAAGWLTGLDEARAGLDRVRAGRLAVQFGGAAGTLASLGADGPRVAALLAGELGLPLPVLPWHTDRLRIVEVAASCAGAAAVLGKIARDVTLLAQSEVAEVREGEPELAEVRVGESRVAEACEGDEPGAAARRGGSSAMPHKRNPVAAIAILGCTRQVPGLCSPTPGRRRRRGASSARPGPGTANEGPSRPARLTTFPPHPGGGSCSPG
jgi:3-carboxy-cis,cis-muconate cycloisomerase